MEKVTGIGGFFFKARDPEKLAAWYLDMLGIDPIPSDFNGSSWKQAAGETAFAPFDRNTDYFGRAEQQWMINFRVNDLDAMVNQLEKAGIAVTREGDFPNGRFARLSDPEGNPVQLWEPAPAE